MTQLQYNIIHIKFDVQPIFPTTICTTSSLFSHLNSQPFSHQNLDVHPNLRRSLGSRRTSILQWDHPQDATRRHNAILPHPFNKNLDAHQMSLFIPLLALIIDGLVAFQVELVAWFWGFQFGCEVCDFPFEKKANRGFVKDESVGALLLLSYFSFYGGF